jgi:chromosome segregation ATPase
MKTINWRPRHCVSLVLLFSIGAAVLTERSCYGRTVLERRPTLTIKPVQLKTVNEMNGTISKAIRLHESLKNQLDFKNTSAEKEYGELLKAIRELRDKAEEIRKEVEELNSTRERMLEEVNVLEGEKKALKDENEELSRKAEELGKSIGELSNQVGELENDKKNLETNNALLKDDVDNLEKAKATIKAWFGGGMTTSVAGIVLLVLKIMSQKKDIKLKQIEIDNITKKKD